VSGKRIAAQNVRQFKIRPLQEPNSLPPIYPLLRICS